MRKPWRGTPLLHRFTVVFDREGYSPDLMQRMKDKRVACLTYRKYPGADWAEDEFQTRQVKLANGQTVDMRLAERGTCLGNRLWVREFRKLTERGHQTAILATDYRTAGGGPVRPLVSGELLQVCPPALRPRASGGLFRGGHS